MKKEGEEVLPRGENEMRGKKRRRGEKRKTAASQGGLLCSHHDG